MNDTSHTMLLISWIVCLDMITRNVSLRERPWTTPTLVPSQSKIATDPPNQSDLAYYGFRMKFVIPDIQKKTNK
jgi:hypothetical protein